MKFAKITNIMLWVLMGISLFLIISLLSNLDENTADAGMDAWLNYNLVWSYILLGICCIAAVSLELFNTISDRKATKDALIAIGFLGGVFILSYLLSDSEIPKFYGAEKFVEDGTLTPSVSKWIGTGLIASYILSGLAFMAFAWSSVSRIFK
jgi:hypothetical protein